MAYIKISLSGKHVDSFNSCKYIITRTIPAYDWCSRYIRFGKSYNKIEIFFFLNVARYFALYIYNEQVLKLPSPTCENSTGM